MPLNTTLLYTNNDSLTFDMPYYLSHHWPLVIAKWGPYGLLDWKVVQFAPTPGDSPESKPPYKVQAVITWQNKEAFTTVMASEDWKTVMDDVPNFCNEMPVMMVGDIVGSS